MRYVSEQFKEKQNQLIRPPLKLYFEVATKASMSVWFSSNQARTADGIVRGSVIAKANKIELKWAVLTPEVWANICTFFDKHFYFNATYYDMQTNSMQTKTMYVGDRSAQPFKMDSVTGKPLYYLDCQANIIGVGETL